MKNIILLTLLIFSSSMFCQDTTKTATIAVIDFTITSGYEDIALAFTDRLEIELLRSERFNVVSRGHIDKIIKEQQLQNSGITEDNLIEIGKVMGLNYLITGSIIFHEFKMMDSIYLGRITSLYSKLIDVETGVIQEVSYLDNCRESVDTAAKKIAKKFIIQFN